MSIRMRHAGPGRAAARGVTLVELMVALVLGLIVTGAAMAVFLSNRQTYLATESMGRLQENARTAFEFMARDIRAAGMIPCSNETDLNNIVDSTEWWTAHGAGANPTEEWANTSFLGYSNADGDALQLIAAIPPAVVPTVLTVSATAGGLPLDLAVNDVAGISAGDLVMICDFGYVDNSTVPPEKRGPAGAIFQATSASGTTINISGTGAPGNAMGAFPNIFTPASGPYPQKNAIFSVLQPVRWYIGDNARGGKSLFRSRLVNTGGALSLAEDEIVANADGLDLAYLVDGADSYVDAASVADWSKVVAVRIQLHMAGTDRVDGDPIERTLEHVVTVRNRAL